MDKNFTEELTKALENRFNSTNTIIRGTSPVALLGIAFIVLKLTGVIAWSWIWVLAPFWVPLLLVLLLMVVAAFICVRLLNKVEEPEEEKPVEEAPKKKTRKPSKKSKNDGGTTEKKNE